MKEIQITFRVSESMAKQIDSVVEREIKLARDRFLVDDPKRSDVLRALLVRGLRAYSDEMNGKGK